MDPLPIDGVLPQLIAAVRRAPAAVLQAPPGAGKTTRAPLALRAIAGGQVVVLEPRRVAARAAAHALARNLGERPGGRVGYQVRFETVASRDTEILVVTEGILTRRFARDPTLEGVGVVVLDEIHERSLHSDLCLAFCRELMDVRDDLKVVAMSATLDAAGVARFLGDCPVITSEGRPFPVRITHREKEREDRYVDERVAGAVRDVLASADDDGGDVLCFLPGAPEIRRAEERLADLSSRGIDVLPLYGALPPAEQDRAIERGPRRRVVLATNVAETSLTLPGVTCVVDSGLMKLARHDPATDRTVLETVRISLSSAEQRAGRAGRVRPGRAVRLWTLGEHGTLEASHPAEVMRADLAPALLDVLAFHPGRDFAWFEAPPPRALERAQSLLKLLGAVDDELRLTERGRALASLPVHPRTGAMLLAGGAGDVEELALAAAILEDERAWPRDAARTSTDSDLDELIATFDHRRQRDVSRAQGDLVRLVKRMDAGAASLKQSLLAGFPDRLCRRRKAGAPEALMVGGRGVALGRESGVLDSELFLALALEGAGASARVRIAEAVSLDDVRALASTADEAVFDAERGALAGVRRTRVAGLVVDEKPGIAVSPEAAAHALADVIGQDLARLLPLDDDARRLRERLAFAQRTMPEHAWPAVDDDAIRALLPSVCAGKKTIAAVQQADWRAAIAGLVPWDLMRVLDDEVPARIAVPTGNKLAVDYGAAGGAPVLAVRLQEVFGLLDTPRVAKGRVRVVMHLLSPGYKPVQVTTDLASFWRSTYAEVKRELKARYPKHSWPDDPLTAPPVAKGRSTR